MLGVGQNVEAGLKGHDARLPDASIGACRRHVRQFGRNQAGAVSIIFGLCAVMFMLFAGAAVDYGFWHHARNKTQAALDAAVLAAARALQTNGGDEVAATAFGVKYFEQAVSGLTSVNNLLIDIEFTDNHTSVVASTKASVSTPFMGLVGVHSLPLFVQGDASNTDMMSNGTEYAKSKLSVGSNAGTNIEVSIMLDVTSSMCDDGVGPCTTGTKIDALKASAKDLTDIVVWQDQSKYTSRVALVPFSTRVRVGTALPADVQAGADLMKKLTNLDKDWTGWVNECTSSSGGGGAETNGTWTCSAYQAVHENKWLVMPCATDRTGPQAFTDAPPGSNAWLNAHGGDRMVLSSDSSDTPATTQLGKTKTDLADNWNYNSDGSCSDIGEANVVVPLTSDKVKLQQKIDALQAYGATGGALGTAWAWYMVAPDWRNIWTGTSEPAPYSDLSALGPNGEPKLQKIVVLLTDGSYNTYRGWKDQPQNDVSNNAMTLCANMKAKGVTVYTVGFDLDKLPGGEQTKATEVLSTCASNPRSFYNATGAEQLKQAFHAIALKVSSIYLAK